jgi:hypothetical protein
MSRDALWGDALIPDKARLDGDAITVNQSVWHGKA